MQTKAETLAAKLAATANPANNAPEAERVVALEKLRAHCAKHNLDFAAYAPFAAQPEPEATEQPAPKAADARAKRRATVAELIAGIRHVYAGASPAFRRSASPCTAGEYADYIDEPVQTIGKSGPTDRDDSALLGILSHATADGFFNAPNLCIDRGAFSRLASGGFFADTHPDPESGFFAFTETGLSRARAILNRAKA